MAGVPAAAASEDAGTRGGRRQRFYVNPGAPVHVTSGAGGNVEMRGAGGVEAPPQVRGVRCAEGAFEAVLRESRGSPWAWYRAPTVSHALPACLLACRAPATTTPPGAPGSRASAPGPTNRTTTPTGGGGGAVVGVVRCVVAATRIGGGWACTFLDQNQVGAAFLGDVLLPACPCSLALQPAGGQRHPLAVAAVQQHLAARSRRIFDRKEGECKFYVDYSTCKQV